MVKLSIIMPVYQNEEIEGFISDIQDKIRSKFPDSEFIIAEDGSKDNTREILKSIQNKYNLTFDFCDGRRGYADAVKSIYNLASGDVIFFLDSDGEHDPLDFWKLYKKFNDGYDIVVGYKINRRPLYRLFISRINNFLVGLLFGIWFKDANCGFRIMKNPIKDFVAQSNILNYAFNIEMLVRAKKANKKMTQVSVKQIPTHSTVFSIKNMPVTIVKSLKELYALHRAASK